MNIRTANVSNITMKKSFVYYAIILLAALMLWKLAVMGSPISIGSILIIAFSVITFLNFKLALMIFIVLRPFLYPSLAFANVQNIPLISVERVLYTIILLAFFVRIASRQKKKELLRSMPFRNAFLFVTVCLAFVTFQPNSTQSGILSYFSILLEYFLLFVIVWITFEKKKEILHVFQGLFIAFFIITLYGIYTRISNSNPYLSMIPQSDVRTLTYSYADYVRAGILGRTQSTFAHPITYGAHLAMLLPFLFVFWIEAKKNLRKLFYLFLIVLVFINLILTNSRSPILFAGIALIGLLCISKPKYRIKLGIFGALLLLFLYVFPDILSGYRKTIFSSFIFWKQPEEISGGSTLIVRWNMIQAAFSHFKARPIFGYGLTTLRQYTQLQTFGSSLGYGESYLMELMLDTGFIGILSYTFLYTKIFRALSKMVNSSIYSLQKGIVKSALVMFVGLLVFVTATGEMRTFGFFYILLALSIKYYSLSRQRQLVEKPYDQ